MITGLDDKATKHISEISGQMSVLYPGRASEEEGRNAGPTTLLPTHISSRVDTQWYRNSRTTDVEWAKQV